MIEFMLAASLTGFAPSCNVDRIVLKVTKLPRQCDVSGRFLGRVLYLDRTGKQVNPVACGFPGEAWGTTMTVAPEIEPSGESHRAWYPGFWPGDIATLSVSTTVDGVDFYDEVTVEY